MEPLPALVVAGGVAANSAIRTMLTDFAAAQGMRFVAPPLWLCTDNGAMIAWAGAERFAAGLTDGEGLCCAPTLAIRPERGPGQGAGVKA